MRRALLVAVWTALFLALVRVAVAAPHSEGNPPRASPARAPQSQPDSQQGLAPFWTAPHADLTLGLAWGDADLDGDLDLLLANDGLNRLYANRGGTLSETWTFDSGDSRSLAWGDYDRDGYLDIAVGNLGQPDRVYHNEGNLTFSLAWQTSISTSTTSVAWAGWEIDSQYHAFLAVGVDGGPTRLYGYQGATFAPVWTATLVSATQSLAWGDYDRDGDPDLAVGNAGQANLIYRNDWVLSNTLTLVLTTAEVSQTHSLAWGDLDGDGYLDLAVGNKGPPGADQVYCNSGPPGYDFSPCWTSGVVSPTSAVAWGDYDGDGDLDLAASGGTGPPTRLYLNLGGTLSPTPTVPLADAGTDGRAVAWADLDGDGDLDLTVGAYASPTVVYANANGCFTVTDVSVDLLDSRSLAWGDMNADGAPDLAVGNTSWGRNQVFSSTGQALSLTWASTETEHTRSLAWADFDGDGRLDLAVGNGRLDQSRPNRFYPARGDAFGLSWTFGGGDTYSLAWGDFDGDQDLDLAVGNYGDGEPNQVFVSGASAGSLGFIDTLALAPASDQTRSLAWADFDQDGDLDLAVGNRSGPNRVYINNGSGSLSFSTAITLPGVGDTYSLAWADFDGDGDLDLAVGDAGAGGHVGVLIAKEANGAWTFERAFTLPQSIDVRSVAWGDYDGDGDPDLAVGSGSLTEASNALYRNEQGALVRWWSAPAAGKEPTNALAWGDYDRDGDLDLAVANTSSPSWPNRLYINNRLGPAALANDPAYAVIDKPGGTPEAAFFANYQIVGAPTLTISYTLYDDEGDRVFRLVPLISWNGGGRWEAALEAGGDGTSDLTASPPPTGTAHVFVWDALSQLLAHQGAATPPLPAQPGQEMDVAFRLVAWSNPEHGGLIQRPALGTDTTLFRLDLRPDWYDSELGAEPATVRPGEKITYTLVVRSAGHGLLPGAGITIPLPAELTLLPPPVWNVGRAAWSIEAITWTGTLSHQQALTLTFQAQASQPLTDGLALALSAHLFDGLHAPFVRRTTNAVESAPDLNGSRKLVNGQPANAVPPGSPLTYTLVLSNSGNDNARQVLLTDALPSALLWAGRYTASAGTATYAPGALSWRGDVRVGQTVTVTYRVTLAQPLPDNTLVTNTARVSAANLAAFWLAPSVTTTVLAPDLRLSRKRVSAEAAQLEDVLTYTLVLSNAGALAADPLRLSDPLPSCSAYRPASYQASSPGGGYDAGQRIITWSGRLEPGAAVTVGFALTLEGDIDACDPLLVNRAQVEDPLGGGVTLLASTILRLPDLSTSQKTAGAAEVAPGGLLTYTLVIRNTGGHAPQVEMVDPLPQTVNWVGKYVASQGTVGYDAASHEVRWAVGPLPGGQEASVAFQVQVGAVARGTITNAARLGHGGGWLTKEATVAVYSPYLYLPLILKSR